jgi:inward rectifier potassium channel
MKESGSVPPTSTESWMAGPQFTSPAVTSARARSNAASASVNRSMSGTGFAVRGLNRRWSPLGDLYHGLLTLPWLAFIAVIVGGYVVANLIFAAIYTLLPDAINGSTGFVDNFFFSVQTWATIGYGGMTPRSTAANIVVLVESMAGIFGVAILTGLLFAKFSRPSSKILFADVAVVTTFEGKPTLMIRVANERHSTIADATAHLTLLRPTVTAEGHQMRRLYDLKLVRDMQPVFRISWTLLHVIDEQSPLSDIANADGFDAADARVVVSMMGYDAIVGQTTHASFVYSTEHVRFGHRYVDATQPDGKEGLILDYAKFHLVEPTSTS